jgi:hypothetical protein
MASGRAIEMTKKNLRGFTVRGLDTPERARAREQEDTCRKCGGKKERVMTDNLDSMEMIYECPKCERRGPSVF